MQFTVHQRFFFDAAHTLERAIETESSRRIHGHTYWAEVSVRGPRNPDNGMVMEFGDIKRIANTHLVDKWDHAFLAYRNDRPIVDFLASLPGHKTVLLDVVPTAENLALAAFRILDPHYQDSFGNHLRLEQVRLFETPNCWADATRDML